MIVCDKCGDPATVRVSVIAHLLNEEAALPTGFLGQTADLCTRHARKVVTYWHQPGDVLPDSAT